MNDKLIECFTNPTKSKLLLEILAREKQTAKQLAEKFSDIPQATLYRHLKQMTSDNILQIVEKNPIRGTVENVYAVAKENPLDIEKLLRENNGAFYMRLFSQYVMGLMQEFREYTESTEIDILHDGSGFTTAPVYATAKELEDAIIKIGEIIMPLYQNPPNAERRLHNLCIITTPPKKQSE